MVFHPFHWVYLHESEIQEKIKKAVREALHEEVYVDISFTDVGSGVCFVLSSNEDPSALRWSDIGRFTLVELPGCCAYLVSTGTLVEYDYRNKGIAQALLPVKEYIARLGGYSYLMCTTIKYNEAQNHILQKCGWEKVNTILNRRTTNEVTMWMKKLEY